MAKVTVRERLRYRFDNAMSRGTPALIAMLGIALVALIALITTLAMLLVPDPVADNPFEIAWMSLLRTLDPGTMGGDTGTAQLLALMLAVTVGGIFIVSALVGILATGLNARLGELRKGRSRVVESGHTVVLGWSDQIFTTISELVRANEGGRACVTILADRDKVQMEDDIRLRLHRTRRVRIVCRRGSPTEPIDLELVRPDAAAAILVPVPAGDEPDIDVIKTLLALRNRRWSRDQPPVVAAVADSPNLAAAVLAGGEATQVVDAKDIIARLIVQSRRQPGLSAVWTDLLGFEGDEIYMRKEPTLVGSTYENALSAYASAAVFGLRRPDGAVTLNPPRDTEIGPDDELVMLAKSRSAIRLATRRALPVESAISLVRRRALPVEDTLVLGWNDRGPTIIKLLDRYLPPRSTVEIAARWVGGETLATFGELKNLAVSVTPCNPTERRALDAIDPSRFEHVVVLAEDDLSTRSADSRTLVTLLHLRDMKERRGDGYAIVSELNDDANRRLAQVTRADDFVIGRKLISLYLTQLSQNQHLSDVFTELFDARGSDVYLRPADEYLIPDVAANFATVVEAARRRDETAIGYRVQREAYDPPAYGVVLNPPKAQPVQLHAADRIVVLASVQGRR